MKQDERVRECPFGRNEILDIDLLDQEIAIRVVLDSEFRREFDDALLPAGDRYGPAADMEAAEVLQGIHREDPPRARILNLPPLACKQGLIFADEGPGTLVPLAVLRNL